jgi:hypothetical protein
MPGPTDPETDVSNRHSLPVSNLWRSTSGAKGSRHRLRCLCRAVKGVLSSADRNLVCILIAVGIGCIGPLKAELQTGGLRWMGSVWDQLGKTNVVLSTILLGSALQPNARLATRSVCAWFKRSARGERRPHRINVSRRQSLRSAGGAAELGQYKVGSGASAESEAHGARSSSATLEIGLPAGSCQAAVGSPPGRPSDLLQDNGSTPLSPRIRQQRLRITLAAILLKLVVMPAICIPLQVRHAACTACSGHSKRASRWRSNMRQ